MNNKRKYPLGLTAKQWARMARVLKRSTSWTQEELEKEIRFHGQIARQLKHYREAAKVDAEELLNLLEAE